MVKKKFINYWDIVKNGKNEKDISKIHNIIRGHTYEKEAITYFEKISKASLNECGFYIHPSNILFGSSPDAIGPVGIIVEIKTRAENSQGPIESLSKFPHYYVQCLLQMACTDSHTCILLSYHPETQSGNFFAIKKDEVLINLIIDICESIIQNKPLECNYFGNADIEKLCSELNECSTIFNFIDLKPLRLYIKKLVKNIPLVEFLREIDFVIEKQ